MIEDIGIMFHLKNPGDQRFIYSFDLFILFFFSSFSYLLWLHIYLDGSYIVEMFYFYFFWIVRVY